MHRRDLGQLPLLLLPGALVVFFSFQAGGFFPGATAVAAIGLVLILVLRITTARRPFEGLSFAWAITAALLALFAIWTLLSAFWSDAPARALIEYDRALLYVLAFVVFGASGRTPRHLRWMVRGLVAAVVVVCTCALATRLAPDVWLVATQVAPERLSYPLTYWNALGLLAALGCVLCFGLTTDAGEPRLSRVLAAAAIPALASTVVLTISRGGIVAAVVGLLALVCLARPALLPSGLIAVAPTVAAAVAAILQADLVSGPDPTSAAAAMEGHDLALILAACTAAAALLRLLALRIDGPLVRMKAPTVLRRPVVAAAGTLAVLGVLIVAAVATGAPDALERQVERFREGNTLTVSGQDRLTNVGNNGRLDTWRVSLEAYRDQPLRGGGAGTWPLEWELRRPVALQSEDAHSLYLEVLAELGIVGLALLVVALLLILGGLALRARGPERGPAGALAAAGVAWALHAGIDWDWEVPAVTLWLFAAGGLALAAPQRDRSAAPPRTAQGTLPQSTWRAAAAICALVMALAPLSIVRSQRPLADSQRAFARNDCLTTIDRALSANDVLASRPEPYYLVGLCDIRQGFGGLALRALGKAVRADPRNWEYHYGLALVRGAAGMDPRASAREALRLNPKEPLAATAVRRFNTDEPRVWRRRALASELP